MVKENFISNLREYKIPKGGGMGLDEYEAIVNECMGDSPAKGFSEEALNIANMVFALGYRKGEQRRRKAARA